MMPQVIKVRQNFPNQSVADIEGAVVSEIIKSGVAFPSGSTIALAVGSRGIANIRRIVKATVRLPESPELPGGSSFRPWAATAGPRLKAQIEILAGYGITEDQVGAPTPVVHASRRAAAGGFWSTRSTWTGMPRPPTGSSSSTASRCIPSFRGKTESGLLKMCVIGLGKHRQALEMHRYGVYGLRDLIPVAARQILSQSKIRLGIGIVENAYDETAVIRAVRPEQMAAEEERLLDLSKSLMPSLPVDQLDLLIIDQMGKDISGTGMDPNIIGRIRIRNEKEPETPDITNIIVTDLSEASHGNALGMGLADFITRRLSEKIDFLATYENILTSTFTERGKMPMVADTDRGAIEYAFRSQGLIKPEDTGIIRIKNTLCLSELYVSGSVYERVKDQPQIEVIGSYGDLLDEQGALKAF